MLKCILVLLLIAAVEETSLSQYNTKLYSDISLKNKSFFLEDSSYSYKPEKELSPALSGTLSFLLPGLAIGQLINKQYLDFGLRVGATAFAVLTVIAYPPVISMGGGGGHGSAWTGIAAVIFVLNWLTSVPDAIFYAVAKNKEIRLKNRYLREYRKTKIGWNMGYDLRGVNMRAVVSF